MQSSNGQRGIAAEVAVACPSAPLTISTESTSPSHDNSDTLVPTMLSTEIDSEPVEMDRDIFIKVYFKCFHRYHPCVLPASRLQQYSDNPSFHDQLLPVMAVIRYIGSIYARSYLTEALMKEAEAAIAQACQDTPRSPFVVQALLLYSISLYWSFDDDKSRDKMDLALQIALQLGMNHRSFAAEAAPDDPLLQECFRRTWWQIYIVDAAYASIKRSPVFDADDAAGDVDLPCSEEDYERDVRYFPSRRPATPLTRYLL